MQDSKSMAVRALEGDGDTISRKMAIDAVAKWFYDVCTKESDGTATIFKRLRELPSAQPPASECWRCNCKKMNIVHGLDGMVYTQDKDKQGWKGRLPPAQPQRKKGKWIPVDSFSAFGGDEAMWMAYGNPVAFYYCSECKEQAYAGEDGESLLTDFCPSCGADMRGESE